MDYGVEKKSRPFFKRKADFFMENAIFFTLQIFATKTERSVAHLPVTREINMTCFATVFFCKYFTLQENP